MHPRWHILFGAIFSLLIWIVAPQIKWTYLALVFLSAFLIDFDHYLCFVLKKKKLGIFHAFKYHNDITIAEKKEKEKGIIRKGDFHLFHTIEFHILVGLLSFTWIGFFYVFLGMVFHSLLDLYSLLYDGFMYRREFFLTAWLWRRFTN